MHTLQLQTAINLVSFNNVILLALPPCLTKLIALIYLYE